MLFRVPAVTTKLSAFAVTVCLGLTPTLATAGNDRVFNRIATFPVYLNTDINDETVAEIVDASKDGKTLIYTDSETGKLGFVDIENPAGQVVLGLVVGDGHQLLGNLPHPGDLEMTTILYLPYLMDS